MSVSSFIRDRRIQLDLTLAQVAEAAGVTSATVQRWESGGIKKIGHKNIPKLASALGVSVELLRDLNEGKTASNTGDSSALYSHSTNIVSANQLCVLNSTELDSNEFLIVIMPDDAMAPTLLPGDQILISKKDTSINNGKMLAVKIGEAVFIRYPYLRDTELLLIAKNETFPPISLPVIQLEGQSPSTIRLENAEVLGNAVLFQRNL